MCQYRKSCQYVVNLILMSVQKNTLFASIFFFHTVCQYIFFSFCTGIGKCWYASTKKSILYWHEDRDFYDVEVTTCAQLQHCFADSTALPCGGVMPWLARGGACGMRASRATRASPIPSMPTFAHRQHNSHLPPLGEPRNSNSLWHHHCPPPRRCHLLSPSAHLCQTEQSGGAWVWSGHGAKTTKRTPAKWESPVSRLR